MAQLFGDLFPVMVVGSMLVFMAVLAGVSISDALHK